MWNRLRTLLARPPTPGVEDIREAIAAGRLAQAEAALDAATETLDDKIELAVAFAELGAAVHTQRPRDAAHFWSRSLHIHERVLGTTNLDLLAAACNALSSAGAYRELVPLRIRQVAVLRRAFGSTLAVLSPLVALAMEQRALGDHRSSQVTVDEASMLLERVQKETDGEQSELRAALMTAAAFIAFDRGDPEAASLFMDAFAETVRLDKETPVTHDYRNQPRAPGDATLALNVARAFVRRVDLVEARRWIHEAETLRRPADAWYDALARAELALAEGELDRAWGSVDLAEHRVDVPPEHPRWGQLALIRARVLRARGELEASVALARKTVERFEGAVYRVSPFLADAESILVGPPNGRP